MKKLCYILFVALLFPFALSAQDGVVGSESVRVYFRQGKSTLERGFMGNDEALTTLAERIEQYGIDSTKGKGRVRVSSSVSPEGSNAVNERLIKARAKSISDWVSNQFDVEIGYIVDSMGVDWNQLAELVKASEKVPFKQEVLDIIYNTPEKVTSNGKVVNKRQRALEQLRKGVPYAYIYKNIYPQLRYAVAYTEIWYAPLITITSPTELAFSAEGASGTITYTKEEGDNATPVVSSDADWIANIAHNGCEITFDVKPNMLAKSRKATIVVDHYENLNKIEVVQEAAEPNIFFVGQTPIEVDAIGGRSAISFTTNTNEAVVPVVTCDADWISKIKVSSSRISFTVGSNIITEPRSATLRVEALGKVYEVVVNQAAAAPREVVTNVNGDAVSTPQLVFDRTESVRVYFRQGSAELDQKYMNNGETLKKLAEVLKPYVVENATNKGKVRISSSVSPEGSNAINDRLVKARARAIAAWISKRFNVEVGYIVDSMGVDWETLITLVEEAEDVPYREEVLDILYNTPEKVTRNGKVINERQVKLQQLRKGVPYKYIYTKIYPKLRYAAAYTEIWYASEMMITSESPIRFTEEGGNGVITFEKNVDDKVVPRTTCTADWISDVVADADDITFKVAENPVAEPRTSKIYIECYGKVYEVVVEQEAADPVCTITSDNNKFGPEGGNGVITYTTNTTSEVVPVAESSSEWLSDIVSTPEGITYKVAENPMAEPRRDTITVSCFDQVHQVVVEQEAAEPELTFTTQTPRNIGAFGGADTVAFKTNSPKKVVPTVSTEVPWITNLVPAEDHIAYSVARNRLDEPRSAVIAVECFDKTQELVVNQAARSECPFPFYMSLKNNALYDLALIPNIGAEFYLGHNFSVAANWHYAWWKSDRIHWYWRTYGGDLSLRYWFGKAAKDKPLTGHHVGVYGQILTYDFELGNKGILADRWSWSAGLEYGYSLPLAPKLNLDITTGVGYHTGTFYEYLPIDNCYVWQATKNRKYIGPTKLEVSLVWLLGCKNYNEMKGGNK